MPEAARPPRSVLVTAVLTVLEAVAAAVVTVLGMVGGAAQESVDGIGVGLFWLVIVVVLAWTSWQYLRARPWARTAIVTWHLLVIFSLLGLLRYVGSGDRIGAIAGMVASLVALVLVFTREARAHIVDTRADILD